MKIKYKENKETFYPFFFFKRNLSFLCDYDNNIQIWMSKLHYTPHLKNLAQLLICFSYFHVVGMGKLFRICKKQTFIFIFVEDVLQFYGSNIQCFEYLSHVH